MKSMIKRATAGLAGLLLCQAVLADNCVMRLSGEQLDYGVLNKGQTARSSAGMLALGKRRMTLSIQCEAPSAIRLRLEAEPAAKGMALWSGKGHYRMTMGTAQLDGQPVLLAAARTEPTALEPAAAEVAVDAEHTIWAVADGKPARGKLFTAQIWVDAQVAANALRARDVEHLSSGGRLLLEKGES
ncbi:hypothetical protein ACUXVY_20315 [Chromobacterium haemolyticum]|uniref:hypothetical protein n=1 Tax=Chromobacterium haemolyticum TaxID=394935 RepID=UPI004057CA15